MEKVKKHLKDVLIIILLLSLSISSVCFMLKIRNDNVVTDNKYKEYEYKIDSIQNNINLNMKQIDSLNSIIELNDEKFKDLVEINNRLNKDVIVNKKKYNEKNKEIQEMSNDSVVLYVRGQLMLWSDE